MIPIYILTISFFNLGLVLANPSKGGDRAANGLNTIGTAIEGGVDSLAEGLGGKNTTLGGIVSGLGDIIGGVGETAGAVVNNTVHVSKSQKNIFSCL